MDEEKEKKMEDENQQEAFEDEEKVQAENAQLEGRVYRKKFTETKNFTLLVCSFLPGSDIFHKIAVLSRKLR